MEIPVTIERDPACKHAIKVRVTNLPDGMIAEPVVSEPKGNSAKKVVLKVGRGCVARFAGPLQIIGETEGRETMVVHATAQVAGTKRTSKHLWLTLPPTAP